jgi:hypothetical protein
LRRATDRVLSLLLVLVDAIAAILFTADLIVVSLSVYYRYVLAAPIEWADDAARGLMVAMSFFGAAGALARNENAGVAFFVQKLGPRARRRVDVGSVDDRRVGSMVRDCLGAVHHRPDDWVRPPAGIDILSDGLGHALHGDFRAWTVLPAAAV